MASREKKSGGDFVLESRHLVGLFLLLVVIFGVVFTLGYLLGRSQYDTRLRAAVGKPPEMRPAGVRSPAAKSKGKPEIVETRAFDKIIPIGISITPPNPSRPRIICRRSKKTVAAAQPAAAPKPAAASCEDCETGEVLVSAEWRR